MRFRTQPCWSRAAALCACLLPFALGAASWSAPLDSFLPAGSAHHEDVPTPAAHLGFEIGEWHAYSHQIMGYLRALEATSPRVKVVPYGRSHGQRELVLTIITSPANHARLDVLLDAHRAASEVGSPAPAADLPLIVWLGYSVHGNESSAANAVPPVAYHLAAASDAEMEAFLERTIVIIDPILNPDGHDRFASWANDHRGQVANADPQTREHTEGFPTGRVNYYWFDLNRDWLPLTHPESQGRMAVLHRWRPHVLGDFHEMGTNTTYFFQPGVPTRVHPLTPPRNQELTAAIATFHAAAFDRQGVLYFTGERFDDFYMGKGSSYPDLHGAVGILFEQASSRGHRQESTHGTLSFAATIRNQVTTSLSTLAGADAHRDELKAHQREFYAEAARLAAARPVQYHLLGAPGDPVRLDKLVRLLHAHGIHSRLLARAVTIDGQTFAPGDAVAVPVAQREFRYLEAIFEERTTFEENAFYDLSTWTMPAAYALQRADVPSLPAGALGPVIESLPMPTPAPLAASPVGWVIDAEGLYVPRALGRLLLQGFFIKAAAEPLAVPVMGAAAPVVLPRGSLFLPAALQGGRLVELREALDHAAVTDGVRIYAVASGLTPAGADLGSSSFGLVEKPSILLAMGAGTSQTEAGALWHVLDAEYELPVTLVEATRLGSIDLSRYTAIILPPGTYRGLGKGVVEAVTEWVKGGGTLVAVGSAANWVSSEKIVPVERRTPPSETPTSRPFGEAENDRVLELVAGAILRVNADLTHPLLYGYRDAQISLFRTERVILEPAKNPYQTPLRVAKNPLVSGYLSANNQTALAGSAAALVETLGRGTVIVLADHPAFRGLARGANRLLFNAIFHAPQMRATGGGDNAVED